MNAKTAKYVRKLIKFNPSDEREYAPMIGQDPNGRSIPIETTMVAQGKRRDYQTLKRYFKGEDVILPNHLRELVNG